MKINSNIIIAIDHNNLKCLLSTIFTIDITKILCIHDYLVKYKNLM